MSGGLHSKLLLMAGLAPELDQAAQGLGQAVPEHLQGGVSPAPLGTCASAEPPSGRRFTFYLARISLVANFVTISLCIHQKNLSLTSL